MHVVLFVKAIFFKQIRIFFFRERDGKIVDAKCHSLVAPHVRERKHRGDEGVDVCQYYEQVGLKLNCFHGKNVQVMF